MWSLHCYVSWDRRYIVTKDTLNAPSRAPCVIIISLLRDARRSCEKSSFTSRLVACDRDNRNNAIAKSRRSLVSSLLCDEIWRDINASLKSRGRERIFYCQDKIHHGHHRRFHVCALGRRDSQNTHVVEMNNNISICYWVSSADLTYPLLISTYDTGQACDEDTKIYYSSIVIHRQK